jgi:hypothetical protein
MRISSGRLSDLFCVCKLMDDGGGLVELHDGA